MSLRGTKQSHAIQGGYASVRLPRYARNDMLRFINYVIEERGNRLLYKETCTVALPIEDCFVPYNDVVFDIYCLLLTVACSIRFS